MGPASSPQTLVLGLHSLTHGGSAEPSSAPTILSSFPLASPNSYTGQKWPKPRSLRPLRHLPGITSVSHLTFLRAGDLCLADVVAAFCNVAIVHLGHCNAMPASLLCNFLSSASVFSFLFDPLSVPLGFGQNILRN